MSKRAYSRVENQNGDWDFLLSVSYRPTVIMWPLKVYGKEIKQLENVVELSVQSSNGCVRVCVWGIQGSKSPRRGRLQIEFSPPLRYSLQSIVDRPRWQCCLCTISRSI